MKNCKKGFTLVELLVVIAILAVLATVAIIGYTSYVDNAKQTKANTEVQQIATYISAEFADDNQWGDVVRSSATASALEGKIAECDALKSFSGTIRVEVTNNIITVVYTVDGKTALAIVN